MRDIFNRVKNLESTVNIIINTAGSYAGLLFSVVQTLIFVRVFNINEFAVLTILLVLSYSLANILNFGMPATVYATIPRYLKDKKRDHALRFIKTNAFVLGVASATVLSLIWFAIPTLDKHFFHTQAPLWYFGMTLGASFMFIFQNYVQDLHNSAHKFKRINIAITLSQIVKCVLLVICAHYGQLSIPMVILITGYVGPMVVWSIALFRSQWIVGAFLKTKFAQDEIKFAYSLQYFLSTQLYQLATRADLFLIAYLLSQREVGLYGLVQRVILAIMTSADSITQVLSPRFAQVKSVQELDKLIKHSLMYMLLPITGLITIALIPTSIYVFVFTQKYLQSFEIIRLVSLANIPFTVIAVLLLFFLYTIKKPIHILIANLLFFGSQVVGNYLLIPHIKLLSPPIVYACSMCIVGTYIGMMFVNERRRMKNSLS